MKSFSFRVRLALSATALSASLAAAAMPAAAQSVAPREAVNLSIGSGRLVQLNGEMQDLFVANEAVADVQVRSNTSVFIFGKGAGQTTVYATDRSGQVIYSATIRVGQNLGSVDDMLQLAMPEANIHATTMNGLVLLTGTVAAPADVAEAQRLAQAFVGDGTQVVSRLRTATPQQVMLKVRVAEVSRSFIRELGLNLQGIGNNFSFAQGRDFFDNATSTYTYNSPATTAVGSLRNIFGVDVIGALDATENNGNVTVLAEPTLTALSGETASFLAGGEFPVPIAQQLGQISIEYRQYGVGLAFSPTVLENGRISMRVRPEVSELATEGSIRLNGFDVPGLATRRAETTVELGSGQSFMIAGLMRNTSSTQLDRTPFLGNLPIIGALFRSTRFRRAETELVIVVTPYLVQPMNPNRVALPTDGFRDARDANRILLGQMHSGRSGEQRPEPSVAPGATVSGPGVAVGQTAPVSAQDSPAAVTPAPAGAAARPGFDF